MESINRPVGRDPQEPYKYKTEEIQKDQPDQKNFRPDPKKPQKKSAIAAYLLLLFHKVIGWLTHKDSF